MKEWDLCKCFYAFNAVLFKQEIIATGSVE